MKEYKKPELEIINIDDDIITASKECDRDGEIEKENILAQ